MSSSAAQLPSHRGDRCRHRKLSWAAERRRRCNPSEVCAIQPAAVDVAVQDVRTPATPFVALSAPLSACGRPSNWSGGRPVSRSPVSTRPVRSRCPDARARPVSAACASRAVRIALDLERVGAAGQATFGAPGSTCCCRRQARAAASHAPAAAPRRRSGRPGSRTSARVQVGWLGSREGAGAHQPPAGVSWAGSRRDA
jgi:hypothetical protein